MNKMAFTLNTQTGISAGRTYLTGIPRYPLSGLRIRGWRFSPGYSPEERETHPGSMRDSHPKEKNLTCEGFNHRKTDKKNTGSALTGGAGGAKYEVLSRLLKKRDYWRAIKEKKPPVYDPSIANYDVLYETACKKLPELEIRIAGILNNPLEQEEIHLSPMPRVLM